MRRALIAGIILLACAPVAVLADDAAPVETALIVAVDVSGSIDDNRYRLQMEGIAEALQDPSVVDAMVGPGGILFSMVTFADKTTVVVQWRRIASKQDAAATAAIIRGLPLQSGEFTCLGRMFRSVSGITIPDLPAQARHIVLDVSGDGIDNCTAPHLLREDHDEVLANGTTINGLPILVPGENDTVNVGAFRAPGYGFPDMSKDPQQEQTTLDRWYHDNVAGGPGAFILPANGYEDFKRALRRKFVLEISALSLK